MLRIHKTVDGWELHVSSFEWPKKGNCCIWPQEICDSHKKAAWTTWHFKEIICYCRNLCVNTDSDLKLDAHKNSLSQSCFYHLHNIAELTIVSHSELELMFYFFKYYCNGLFKVLNRGFLEQLHGNHNTAARLLSKSPRFSPTTPILKRLHWVPVDLECSSKQF